MTKANKHTMSTRRREFRKKLESWGMDPKEIELCVKQMKERQYQKANGQLPEDAPLCTRAEYVRLLKKQPSVFPQGATVLRLGDDYETPDDKGYSPTKHDSVLNGVGRATGETARVIKNRKTITKYEYDQRNNGD